MFIIVNIRRMWRTTLRKLAITSVVLLALYLLYQWLGQPLPQPADTPTIARQII